MEAPLSRYRKIEVRTWSDEKFRSLTPLPPCGQGLWFYLLTGPHTGPVPGLFRAGRAGLAEELGWDLKAFDKAFRELTDLGMVKADFQAKLIWIPNALKHNPPGSPNVVKPWGKEFDLLPESPLKREALASMQGFMEGMSEAFVEAFHKAFPKAREKDRPMPTGQPSRLPSDKPCGNQEQQQEQEQQKEDPCREITVRLGTIYGGKGSVEKPANGSAEAWLDDDLDGEPANAA